MRIVADLIHSGALRHIDNVHIDWPIFNNVQSEDGKRGRDLLHGEFK